MKPNKFKSRSIDKVSVKRSKQFLWNQIQEEMETSGAKSWNPFINFFSTHRLASISALTIIAIVVTTIVPSFTNDQNIIASAKFQLTSNESKGLFEDASFTLISSEDFSVEEIEKYLTIESQARAGVQFDIVQLMANEYQIILKEAPNVNTKYNFKIDSQIVEEEIEQATEVALDFQDFEWNYELSSDGEEVTVEVVVEEIIIAAAAPPPPVEIPTEVKTPTLVEVVEIKDSETNGILTEPIKETVTQETLTAYLPVEIVTELKEYYGENTFVEPTIITYEDVKFEPEYIKPEYTYEPAYEPTYFETVEVAEPIAESPSVNEYLAPAYGPSIIQEQEETIYEEQTTYYYEPYFEPEFIEPEYVQPEYKYEPVYEETVEAVPIKEKTQEEAPSYSSSCNVSLTYALYTDKKGSEYPTKTGTHNFAGGTLSSTYGDMFITMNDGTKVDGKSGIVKFYDEKGNLQQVSKGFGVQHYCQSIVIVFR